MKKGYDIGQFQRSSEISLHFWNWADLGVEIDHRNGNIGMVQKKWVLKHSLKQRLASPRISYPKKTPQFGVTDSTSGGSLGRAIKGS